MSSGHALGQRLFERLDDGIDHRRKRLRIVSHRRGWVRTEDFSFRQDEFERPEGAFIGRFVVGDQVFECNPRRGPAAAVVARIDAALNLTGHVADNQWSFRRPRR